MSKGRPRTTQPAVDTRKALLDALTAGKPLPEPAARALVDAYGDKQHFAGWSKGYDEGYVDAAD